MRLRSEKRGGENRRHYRTDTGAHGGGADSRAHGDTGTVSNAGTDNCPGTDAGTNTDTNASTDNRPDANASAARLVRLVEDGPLQR